MRIVFVGAVEFSRECLDATIVAGGDVVGVLTPEPEFGSFHGDFVDLGPMAAVHDVPLFRIGSINEQRTLTLLRSLNPDVIFVFGWSQLLGREVLSLAPCIGSHPALLPRNRGRHPLTWALVEGLHESGLTFLWLDEGPDSGDILWQRSFPIGPEDDAADLYARIVGLAREAIREFLPQLEAGSAPRVAQDDALATFWRKRTDDDRWIDWSAPTAVVHNLVRGLARPYVGALTRRAGQDVLVWRARVPTAPLTEATQHAAPGCVLGETPVITIRTGDGYLEVIQIEPEGMLRAGDVLEGRK